MLPADVAYRHENEKYVRHVGISSNSTSLVLKISNLFEDFFSKLYSICFVIVDEYWCTAQDGYL